MSSSGAAAVAAKKNVEQSKQQKKTNKSVGRNGVFDTVSTNDDAADFVPKGRRQGKGAPSKNGGGEKQQSARSIKADREKKQDAKLKNMKKQDRRRLERGGRAGASSGKGSSPKGFQGKKGSSGRWKK